MFMKQESRVERKFIVGTNNFEFFEKFLKVNSFKKSYEDREVSSIYFDTLNYDFLRANIDGIGSRKKYRIRWYNDDLKSIFFEEKSKKNFLVSKKVKKIDFSFNKRSLNESLKDYYLTDKDKNFKNYNLQIVLKTNYKRSYWLSGDKKIRATIDTNLSTSPYINFNQIIKLPDTILEFKYLPKYENYFREFFKNFGSGLRVVKYSKYVKSFLELNNSGLVN